MVKITLGGGENKLWTADPTGVKVAKSLVNITLASLLSGFVILTVNGDEIHD